VLKYATASAQGSECVERGGSGCPRGAERRCTVPCWESLSGAGYMTIEFVTSGLSPEAVALGRHESSSGFLGKRMVENLVGGDSPCRFSSHDFVFYRLPAKST
jgi:hypothetical protein